MTTRFSVAELANMLNTPIENVRQAISELAEQEQLTKETFLYLDRSWRIAPSDIKKIQNWLQEARDSGRLSDAKQTHRVTRKRVLTGDEPPGEKC